MNKREDYKRFIVFCLASLIILAQAAVFAYVWYDFYRIRIDEPFWRRGNWVLIAIYALINTMFSRLYGGLKVGYLEEDRCILFTNIGNHMYECSSIFSDHTDQPLVFGS